MATTEAPAAPAIEIDGEPTAVYRLYDQDDQLLYVGVAGNLTSRLADHAKNKHWWPQVAKKTAVLHGSRGEALMEEDLAIRTESPVHNIAGSPQRLNQVEKIAQLNRRAAAGRPQTVPGHLIQFSEPFLAPVDAYARKTGTSRSSAMHQLVISGLIRDRQACLTQEGLAEERVILEAIGEECDAAFQRYSS